MWKAPLTTEWRENHVAYSDDRQLGSKPGMQPCLIHRLPTELLCLIFWFILPSTDPISRITMGMQKQGGLFGLIHVCGHWLTILIFVAKFWSSFHITIPESIMTERTNGIGELVHLWVERSRGHVLFVRYTVLPTPTDTVHAEALCDIMDSLFEVCDRWRHLHLDLAPDTFEPLFHAQCWTFDLQLPRLQSIILTLMSPALQGGLEVEIHETPLFGVTSRHYSVPYLSSINH
jgi:hypothetical protein